MIKIHYAIKTKGLILALCMDYTYLIIIIALSDMEHRPIRVRNPPDDMNPPSRAEDMTSTYTLPMHTGIVRFMIHCVCVHTCKVLSVHCL